MLKEDWGFGQYVIPYSAGGGGTYSLVAEDVGGDSACSYQPVKCRWRQHLQLSGTGYR